MKNLLFTVFMFVIILPDCFASNAGAVRDPVATGPTLDLSTLEWRYRIGDDPDWASPEYDDEDWPKVTLPGALPENIPLFSHQIFWLRAVIELPPSKPESIAVYLGRVQDADEFYLNGSRIAGQGTIGKKFWDVSSSAAALKVRVYPLPPSDGNSVSVAIRIQSLSYAPGIPDGPVLLGPAADLFERAHKEDVLIWLRDSVWLSFLVIGFGISLVGIFGEVRDTRNRWLPAFFGTFALAIAPHTIIAAELGLDALLPVYSFELLPYLPLGILHLCASTGVQIARWQWWCFAVYMGWILLMQYNWPMSFMTIAAYTQAALALVIVCASIGRCLRYVRLGIRVSRWTWAGTIGMAIATIVYTVFLDNIPASLDPLAIGGVFMMLSYLLAMAEHHRWDREAVHVMTTELLVTREDERERIARDLHDGVNQRIAVTRFRLERLRDRSEPYDKSALNASIDELRETGHEVAVLVEGLRPILLEGQSFVDAVDYAVERWNRLGDARVVLRATGAGELTENHQQQLFRIIQEAIHNAIRHGQASHILVCFNLMEHRGLLRISDNGSGFVVDATRAGIGITTMRERARLMDASIDIQSAPNKGTRLELSFRMADPK